MLHWAKAHRSAAAAIAVAALALFGLGIYWFGPQRLVLDREVAEALPTPTGATDPSTGEEPLEEPSGNEELGSGSSGASSTAPRDWPGSSSSRTAHASSAWKISIPRTALTCACT